MLKLLQVYLGMYKLDTFRALSIIHNRQIVLLKAVLKKGDYRSREIMLKQLVQTRFFVPALIPSFLRILRKDSISNSQIAQSILEERLGDHPKYRTRLQAAKASLADRLRRKTNRQKVQAAFQLKSNSTLADRKAQMNRLAKVKEDVKKGMRRMG